MVRGLRQGELAKWLQAVADAQDAPGAAGEPVPEAFVGHLLVLRCIERGADGSLRLTDKGRLALRMEQPGALHR